MPSFWPKGKQKLSEVVASDFACGDSTPPRLTISTRRPLPPPPPRPPEVSCGDCMLEDKIKPGCAGVRRCIDGNAPEVWYALVAATL